MAYENFYATTLEVQASASDTTLQVKRIPDTITTGWLVLEGRNATNREIIFFNGIIGNILQNVLRGQQDTSGVAHAAGTSVEMNPTARDFKDLYDAFNTITANTNDWRPLTQVPIVSAQNGQKDTILQFSNIDYSGALQPGTRLRVPRTGTTPTQSLILNGTTQYAQRTATISGYSFTDNITLEALVYFDGFTNSAMCMWSRWDGSNGILFDLTSTGQVRLVGSSAGINDQVVSNQSIPIGRWVHVAASISMAGTTGKVYFDGSEVTSTYTNSAATSFAQVGNIAVGYRGTGGTASHFLKGQINEVRLWNIVRTAQQIKDNYAKQLIGSETNLAGYWKLDTNFNDSTVNVNHLTTVAAAPINNSFGHMFKATEYGIVTQVTYSAPHTLVRVFTGLRNSIPSDTLAASSYSNAHSPQGFPAYRQNWRLELYTFTQPANGATVFTNIGGQHIALPYGQWRVGFDTTIRITTNATPVLGGLYVVLSEDFASKLNALTQGYLYTDKLTEITTQVTRADSVFQSNTAPKFYFLIMLRDGAGVSNVTVRGDVAPSIVYAECEYL